MLRHILALAIFATGCTRSVAVSRSQTPLDPWVRVETLFLADSPALIGVSGATTRADGTIWLAPERTGQLVVFPGGARLLEGPPRLISVVGIPQGADVEAIAFWRTHELLVGTEAKGRRREDAILRLKLNDGRAEVWGALVFDYGPFGIEAKGNQGIDGLCAGPDYAVAASEVVMTSEGQRFALVALFKLPDGSSSSHQVELRSKKGKLSALACRRGVAHLDAIEVFAIERHFGVMRLVRFTLPRAESKGAIASHLVTDLAPHLGPEPPNIEGLTWLSEDVLIAVNDNHYGKKTGPALAFRIQLSEVGGRESNVR